MLDRFEVSKVTGSHDHTGCLQLLMLLEVSWNLHCYLEIQEIYGNFIDGFEILACFNQ